MTDLSVAISKYGAQTRARLANPAYGATLVSGAPLVSEATLVSGCARGLYAMDRARGCR